MRVLVDTNILLDFLLEREPYATDAGKILDLCTDKNLQGCIAAHSVSNMFYILRKIYNQVERRELLMELCRIFHVEAIDSGMIVRSLKNNAFQDFEDCLQAECAKAFGADYIVTRNPRDYTASTVPVISPAELCGMF